MNKDEVIPKPQFTEFNNLNKEANIPCPDNSINKTTITINTNFLFIQ